MWVANATGSRPGGTFVVNVVGSFFIGLFLVLATERFSWPGATVTLVAVGFLGGFTTFSALTWQAVQQLEGGDYASAVWYVGGSVLCGLLAAWAGASIGRIAA
jgi:CrcB protein